MRNIYFLVLLIGCMLSCEEEETDSVKIRAEVPPVIKLGVADTLRFAINSDAYLSTLELKEGNSSYILLDWRTLGKYTREYKLNLVYDPHTAGDKSMVLYASDGMHEARYAFLLKVIE